MQLRERLPATPDGIRQARHLAIAFAEELCDPTDQVVADLAICVSEAATNVVQHADPAHRPTTIDLQVRVETEQLIVQISDQGGASAPVQPGLGLRIISELADAQITPTKDGTTVALKFPCPRA